MENWSMSHSVGMASFDVYGPSGLNNKGKVKNYSLSHSIGVASFDVHHRSM